MYEKMCALFRCSVGYLMGVEQERLGGSTLNELVRLIQKHPEPLQEPIGDEVPPEDAEYVEYEQMRALEKAYEDSGLDIMYKVS